MLVLAKIVPEVVEHGLLLAVVLHLLLESLGLLLQISAPLLVHLVFKLHALKHLASVLLKVVKLLDSLWVLSHLAAHFIKLIVQAKVFETRQKLRLFLLRRGPVND